MFEKQSSVFNQQKNCISYLSLCNKLYPNLAALNQNRHYPPVPVAEESGSGLAGQCWLRVSREGGQAVGLGPGAQGSTSKEAHSVPEALVPCPLSLSVDCPQDMAAGFHQWVIQEGGNAQDGSPSVFSNLIRHFCHLLLVTQTSSGTTLEGTSYHLPFS